MNKKQVLIRISIAIFTITFTYVVTGMIGLRIKMYDYLAARGYEREDVKIKVAHSFISQLLSYDEWGITVEYKAEAGAKYHYRYKDKAIIPGGISGTKDKEDLKHKD